MVVDKLSDDDVDLLFHALADATRRDIIKRVLRKQQSVTSLAEGYAMSFAAIQKHVAVLERAALVRKERNGREQVVHPIPENLRRARQLLDEYELLWRRRIARIDQLLT